MIKGSDGLLVGVDDSAKVNDAGSSSFADGDNVDLELILVQCCGDVFLDNGCTYF